MCVRLVLRKALLFRLESKKPDGVELGRLNLLRAWWISL